MFTLERLHMEAPDHHHVCIVCGRWWAHSDYLCGAEQGALCRPCFRRHLKGGLARQERVAGYRHWPDEDR